jgi:chaperonin GroEL
VSTNFCSKQELSDKIESGVNVLTDNVASTLGPRGRNVILQEKGKRPFVTKDGVTVASFVELDDPVENAAAQLVKQASAKTNIDAGDGTTTSTVLTRAIYKHSKNILDKDAKISPTEIKRGIDKAVVEAVTILSELASPVQSIETVKSIATISANNDESIGELIATAVDKVGKNGSITIEEARSLDTSLDLLEGFRFDSGYAATAFVTNERRGVVRYENALVLVTDSSLETVDQILPSLEIAARESRPLVIVADNIEGQALAALIMNTVRGSMKVAAIKAPRYGETRRNIMSDLALSIDAKYFQQQAGHNLKNVTLTDFGSCKTIEISKNTTTMVGGSGNYNDVNERIELLKSEIKDNDNLSACEAIQERITRLASGIAVIRVGAATEVEMIEKKHRIEDALEAVRSAQQEGVVPGGGITLAHIGKVLKVKTATPEQSLGVEAVKFALMEPFLTMCDNSGFEKDEMIKRLGTLETNRDGIDFNNGELINLAESGIVDPAKVARCALQNAASVASVLITTNFSIIK